MTRLALNQIIYLDNQSTTALDPSVMRLMRPYFEDMHGNASSWTHAYGDKARMAIDSARERIASAIGAESMNDLIFTSGATESNNLAIQGLCDHLRKNHKTHVITSLIEHKSVLDVVGHLEMNGFEIVRLAPNKEGELDLDALEGAVKPATGLISIMHANNEVGIINPISKIAEIAAARGIIYHVDAAQSFGKLPIHCADMGIDLLSFSAHKLYGPKGIGALYINRKNPNLRLTPLMYGGGQEMGLRPGTLPTPLIVGMAAAAECAFADLEQEIIRVTNMKNRLLNNLHASVPDIIMNGSIQNRLPHNINISILGVPSETLIMNVRDQLAISNGSACTSYAPAPSHVLTAMRLGDERISSAIRIGIGRFTTAEDIDQASEIIATAATRLRKMINSH